MKEKEKPTWVREWKTIFILLIGVSLFLAFFKQLNTPIEPNCINTFSKRIPIPMDTCFISGILGDATIFSLYLIGIVIFIYAIMQDLYLIQEVNKKYRIGERIEDEVLDKIIPPNKESLEENLLWHKKEIIRNKKMITRIQKALKKVK